MKKLIYLFLFLLLTPLLVAQPLPADGGGTESSGGDIGAGDGSFAPLDLINPSELNYLVSLPKGGEAILKNTSEHLSTIVVYLQTEDWLITSHSFRVESGQELNFDPAETLSPVKTIQVLSMQSFQVTLREIAPLFGSVTETVVPTQAPPHELSPNYIEDAGGQVISIGVMEDGSVHYPLFGKRIGVVENDTVLIDGTQQRFKLHRGDDQ